VVLQRSNRFLTAYADELEPVRDQLREVTLHAGQVLSEPGERIRQVYFPHEGMASKLTIFEDGMEVECALVGREGVIGAIAVLGIRNAFTYDVCHVDMRAATMDADRFQSISHSSERLHWALDCYCAFKISCAIRNGACNACHSVEQRLARLILTCSDVLEEATIPLSQDRLGAMLAVQRSSVNPILQRFQADGLVRVGRSRLTITDRTGLTQRACECYGLLKGTEHEILTHGIYARSTAAARA
jgi:CRP-like cAMP-binding protein